VPRWVCRLRQTSQFEHGEVAFATKPGDLPIGQPTRFKLVINLNTAKALDLAVPPSRVATADEVIK